MFLNGTLQIFNPEIFSKMYASKGSIYSLEKERENHEVYFCVCWGGGGWGVGVGFNRLSSKFQRINRQLIGRDRQTGFLLISLICHLILINRT